MLLSQPADADKSKREEDIRVYANLTPHLVLRLRNLSSLMSSCGFSPDRVEGSLTPYCNQKLSTLIYILDIYLRLALGEKWRLLLKQTTPQFELPAL
jgi:hypothetical protein